MTFQYEDEPSVTTKAPAGAVFARKCLLFDKRGSACGALIRCGFTWGLGQCDRSKRFSDGLVSIIRNIQ